jgi:integrase
LLIFTNPLSSITVYKSNVDRSVGARLSRKTCGVQKHMPRLSKKLTDLRCRNAAPGTHSDGGGLYLQVRPNSKSWVYRYTVGGKQTWLGLGPYPAITLAQAREKAIHAFLVRCEGGDPLEQKRAARASLSRQRAEHATTLTFDQAADQYIASHRAGWRNVTNAHQWNASLRTYVSPVFGDLPVQAIDVGLVMKTLEPIWHTLPDTASRIRGRIEAILDWARVRGYRSGENPARWKGHLDHLLPRPSKLKTNRHHTSLPYAEIGTFMISLRERDGVASRALEFVILTAARKNEVIGMRWAEIDLATKVWVVPATRMKAGHEHRVALSDQAVALLERMQQVPESEFVFPGQRRATLSGAAIDKLLRNRMKSGVCMHGFRATFRTWAAERTSFPREVVETALAHAVGDKVEVAYQRSDLLAQRHRLMAAWADYSDQEPVSADVISIRATAG